MLREWLRVIKHGGFLVIFCPDQKVYEAVCRVHGTEPNPGHKHKDFGLKFVKKILEDHFKGQYEIVHEIPLIDEYSFDLVLRKL
jgi:predicted SAM-dependent methyltransferase